MLPSVSFMVSQQPFTGKIFNRTGLFYDPSPHVDITYKGIPSKNYGSTIQNNVLESRVGRVQKVRVF